MQIEWRPLYRLVNIYIDLCSSKNRLYRFGSYVYRLIFAYTHTNTHTTPTHSHTFLQSIDVRCLSCAIRRQHHQNVWFWGLVA